MSLMLKLLSSVLLFSMLVEAKVNPELIKQFVKTNVVTNPKVKVKEITIFEEKTPEEIKGWSVVFATASLLYNKKEMDIPQVIFVNGNYVTNALTNLETGVSYANTISPSFPPEVYSKKHLIFGNKDAKHKIVVFSDPQCPFCMTKVPEIMKAAKENPTQIALYYYHLPLLQIHPVADVLTRIMHVAQEQKKLDIVEKIYSLKINAKETNEDKIIEAVKKHTGFSVTKEEIGTKAVKDAIAGDKKMAIRLMVKGTPAVFVDGKLDKSRNQFKKFITK